MKEYPLQIGVTPQSDIILEQTDEHYMQEHVITISPDQVEQVVSALRVAVEVLREPK